MGNHFVKLLQKLDELTNVKPEVLLGHFDTFNMKLAAL